MSSYKFLFDVALILISTKLLGLLTKRLALPQVVGALAAGLLLGPAALNVLQETSFMNQIAEIGVVILMFTAGLETDIRELKRSGKASLVIALCGVLIPLAGGFFLAMFFNKGPEAMLQNVFIGIILTATSVSITVETLKELGKLSTRAGNAILGAALIDDILGIIGLTLITSLADSTVNLWIVLLKIVLFFAFSLIVGVLLHKGAAKWMNNSPDLKRRFPIVAFAFCLVFAFIAEHFFGVADITGAFIAGLIITNTTKTTYVASRFEIMSYMFFSPIFFASIGVKVVLPQMSGSILLFSVLMMLIAILTKVVGCGVGAKLCRYTNAESMQIGVGMISRGEVALIVASKGMAAGLMVEAFFGPIIIMVVVTTIVTPILLKLVFKNKKDYSDLAFSKLTSDYDDVSNLDMAAQALADMEQEIAEHDPSRSSGKSK